MGMTTTQFTVQIEASNPDGTTWQAMHPAEYVTNRNGSTAGDIAEMTAANTDITEGTNWRVCVWNGDEHTADTSAEPAHVWYATDNA